jgi:hypothetical protein
LATKNTTTALDIDSIKSEIDTVEAGRLNRQKKGGMVK